MGVIFSFNLLSDVEYATISFAASILPCVVDGEIAWDVELTANAPSTTSTPFVLKWATFCPELAIVSIPVANLKIPKSMSVQVLIMLQ